MKRISILITVLFCSFKGFSQFTIAFGSCNKPTKENVFWDDIIALQPNVWIWGGDIIYGNTENPLKIKNDYTLQHQQKGYKEVTEKIDVLATWDDHDYGKNDAGAEYKIKKESQQLFLDFIGVSKDSPRRKQKGVYTSKTYTTKEGTVKIILLDTRYHRTALHKNSTTKRYEPNTSGEGTILGKEQWKWLENELEQSTADFNVIVSSIQVISSKHRFEKWANFPHEQERLYKTIASSKAKNTVILSGDRHISEFSKINIPNCNYPIIDFTSSGLTHSYSKFKKEYNPNREGTVVSTTSFGVLHFDFKTKKITFQMRGDTNKVLQELIQTYP